MAPSDFYLFPKLKSHLRGTQYGSDEGVIEAVNEYLGDQEKPSYLNRSEGLNRDWLKAFPCREIILKNNGQILISW